MATFKSNSYQGRRLRLEVTQIDGFCHWELIAEGGSVKYYTVYNLAITIDGKNAYSPGTVDWSTERFPAAKGSISGDIYIGNKAQDKTIYISFIGSVYFDESTQNGGNFLMGRYVWAPTLNDISISSISDKTAYVSFSTKENNGESPTNPKIKVSLTRDFSSPVVTENSSGTTIYGLTPNRTYYIRGENSNSGGTGYTDIKSFKTLFYNPGSPGRPVLSYNLSEPIPKATLTASWTSASKGSTSVAGYRLRVYKNGSEIKTIDTENPSVSYTFGTFESMGITTGDTVSVSILSYSKDWDGQKHFSSSLVYSRNDIKIISDKYIYASINGGAFNKYKIYISVNGSSFTEIKKEKLRVIK